ncbi:magnesium and cobalt transport protein CorA, partial [filamentous cyanobacterium CCP5]
MALPEPDLADEDYTVEEVDDDDDDDEDLAYNYNLPGSAPGTLNIPDDAESTELLLLNYSSRKAVQRAATLDDVDHFLNQDAVFWLDIRGLGTEQVLRHVADRAQLHPLLLEDVVNVPHNPKVDYYEDHLLVIMQMVRPKPSGKGFTSEQVSFVLGEKRLLTFQEEASWDCFGPVRDRIRNNIGLIRSQGADYLMYTLLDTIIDSFFPVLEDLGEYIEELEDEVVANPSRKTIEEIHDLRRRLMKLRRLLWPQRNVINSLIRDGSTFLSAEMRIYLQDCYDHVVQVLDILENYREIASSLMDVYLSSINNRMNEVMKLLTVISSIFIPLTFIAGVYGMNFNPEASPWNMPELDWTYGYPAVWVLMLAIASGLIFFFWRRGWFENFSTTRR